MLYPCNAGIEFRHLHEDDDPTFGDLWTYCAIDAETKLFPAYKVASKRNLPVTVEFISDLKSRMNNRFGLVRERTYTADTICVI